MEIKNVTEEEFKFFETYLDAVLDEKFVLVKVEVEDLNVPSQYGLNGVQYRLKNFERCDADKVRFFEKVFLKIA